MVAFLHSKSLTCLPVCPLIPSSTNLLCLLSKTYTSTTPSQSRAEHHHHHTSKGNTAYILDSLGLNCHKQLTTKHPDLDKELVRRHKPIKDEDRYNLGILAGKGAVSHQNMAINHLVLFLFKTFRMRSLNSAESICPSLSRSYCQRN